MNKKTFVSLALSYLGFPAIKHGGKEAGYDEKGFDCSGFVNFLLKKANYPGHIPRHTNDFFDSFGILVHEQFRGAGDLIFFSHKGGYYPDHIGVMISREKYIHSPGKNGKVICSGVFEKKIIEPRCDIQQIYFSNPIGIKRIAINNGRYKKIFLS